MSLYETKHFKGKRLTQSGQERIVQMPPRHTKPARLAACAKMGILFELTCVHMFAQHLSQLNVYCRHLYYMKTSHEINVSFHLSIHFVLKLFCSENK